MGFKYYMHNIGSLSISDFMVFLKVIGINWQSICELKEQAPGANISVQVQPGCCQSLKLKKIAGLYVISPL